MAKTRTKKTKAAQGEQLKDSTPQVPTVASKCPRCGSTERGTITSTSRRDVPGTFRGEAYDYQIRRWCACAKCGQRRVIVEHHTK